MAKLSPIDSVRVEEASALMQTFARETGISGERPPRRYLWTDAHAVCNYLELGRRLDDPGCIELARTLVAQVHDVLGKHRSDDVRQGWISGLSDEEGARHPTAGGLRIGKPHPERTPANPYDAQLEWDRDGQYYHYLTKWMHALHTMANAVDEARYRTWAVELAIAAHRGFRSRSGPPRLCWKMSIDLSHPLVPSSGLHDPLDGLVTCLALRKDHKDGSTELDAIIEELHRFCRGVAWGTDDPLGIGGLLFDAGRMAQLPARLIPSLRLQAAVLSSARTGLEALAASPALGRPASQRLAFRELGLAIGLKAVDVVYQQRVAAELLVLLDQLAPYRELGSRVEAFWRDPVHRHDPTWQDHGDINAVMLATCLVPGAFLEI